jgi:hypothetical protein
MRDKPVALKTQPASRTMPLHSLVIIVIRLFAISWFVQGLATLVSYLSLGVGGGGRFWNIQLLVPASLLLLAVWGWILAPNLGRGVTRGCEGSLSISGLTLEDLYTFAFVFLGLYYFLGSIAPVINWLHYFSMVNEFHNPTLEEKRSVYQLSGPLITMVVGLGAIMLARRVAKPIAAFHQVRELAQESTVQPSSEKHD